MSNITSSNITLTSSPLSPFSTDFLLFDYNFSSLLPTNITFSNENTSLSKYLGVKILDDFFNGDPSFKTTKNNLGLFDSKVYSQIPLIPINLTVFHARDIRSLLRGWLASHPEHVGIVNLIQQCIETSNERLDLSGQNLGDLDDELIEILSHLTWLKTLKLSFNELRQIPPHAFAQMGQLTNLFLNNNHLTTLNENLFSSLFNLSILHLNNNQLTELHPNLFSNLSELVTLRLDNNQLANLPSNLFYNLPGLSTIYLSHNELTTLQPTIFDGQTQLFFLFLENNFLTHLPNQIFDRLANHAALHLDAHLIRFFPDLSKYIDIYPCQYRLNDSPK